MMTLATARRELAAAGGRARAAKLTPEQRTASAKHAIAGRESKRFYTEWRGPANARLRSDRDLTLTIFGEQVLVRAFRHADPATGDCARIEFYRDGRRQDQATTFTAGIPTDPRFRFSE
jgi:hypothetical protein